MGRAGAEIFAREGARVCIVDHNAEASAAVVKAIRSEGQEAHSIVADLTDMNQCRRMVADAAEALGGLDAYWAHAGAPGPQSVEGLDWEAYRASMALNVDSIVASLGQAIPLLRKGKGPAILMTASVSGVVGSQFSPVYSLQKFAVVGLAKSLALALGPDGIRVNALCPGAVDTAMLPTFMARDGNPVAAREAQRKFEAAVALGRVAQPQEQAHAAMFLLSDEASYVTGVALPVDGGFTAR
jgi:NAD(P)-dependent dehydrogenase (short-subunit alcohol dehydrogenase family)